VTGNLFELLAVQADRGRLFARSGGDARWSYAEAAQRGLKYAAALKGLGVAPGDRVAVQVDKSVEVLLLYVGCLAAGAVYLPLNPAYTEAEVAYFLEDAEPTLAVCRPAARDRLGPIAAKAGVRHVETLDGDGTGSIAALADASPPAAGAVPREADDLAAILYTSGTTGRAKGAMLTHCNLTSNARALAEIWRFSADDVLLHALPIFHTHGLFVATNTCVVAGASMLVLPRFEVPEVLRWLPEATAMMGVPTYYSRLLQVDGFTRDLARHVRLFVSGSAPLSAELHREFEARTGHAILERYGMTETGMNTSNPYDGARRAGTVGFPLPGVEIRIAEPETGVPLPQGEVGVVEIRGPNVFQGYWRQPQKTAAAFRPDGFFISGDLGRIDSQGYLELVGRDKDLIISGGFNVYPAEVEAVLDAMPEVFESAVIGLPHPDFGEAVTAALVLRPGQQLTEADARARLAGQLASYKVPKRILVVDELPRNAMGKIQKTTLREAYRETFN
jgi:malonyl-CoA/methylmalonyl-CoA synthetase